MYARYRGQILNYEHEFPLTGASGAINVYGGYHLDVTISDIFTEMNPVIGILKSDFDVSVDINEVLMASNNTDAGNNGINTKNLVGDVAGATTHLNDLLIGDNQANSISGGAGDDVLIGMGGNDTLDGGTGNDYVSYYKESLPTQASPSAKGFLATVNSDGISVRNLGTGDIDAVKNVETVVLGTGDDRVLVNAMPAAGSQLTVDGGDEGSGGSGDQLDFSGLTTGVIFHNNNTVAAYSGGKEVTTSGTVHFLDFENIHGTSQADVYDNATNTGAKIYLGAGRDIVLHSAQGTIIDLGADQDIDTVSFNGDVKVDNLGEFDKVLVNDVQIHGGNRSAASDDPWASSNNGEIKYGLSTDGELLVQFVGLSGSGLSTSVMSFAGWAKTYNKYGPFIGAGGIAVASVDIKAMRLIDLPAGQSAVDGQLELLDLTIYQATGKHHLNNIDPIVFDLNGDGFNLGLQSADSPLFDTDADLYREHTGWVGREDGMLARDINHDGQIKDARELFGGAQDGFSVLETLDGNHDGVVDAADNGLADFNGDGVVDASDTFAELKIWQDLDQNGQVDDGELLGLDHYGIVALNTTVTADGSMINGNLVTGTATFIRSDGTTGTMGDAALELDNHNSEYIGPDITISAGAAAEPNLKAYGTLVSLQQALSLDPAGITLVDQTMAGWNAGTHDLASMRANLRPLLEAWAEGSPLRDASGAIISGTQVMDSYETVCFIKDYDKVADYSWGHQAETITVNSASVDVTTYSFASGLVMSLTADENPINIRDEWGSPVATSSAVEHRDGVDIDVTKYTYSNGESVYVSGLGDGVTDPLPTESLNTLLFEDSYYDQDAHYFTRDMTPYGDMAFFQRYMGETLPLNVKPVDISAAIDMANGFVSLMNQTLDMLAVRVAVQSPEFASIFTDIVYDDVNNNFKPTTDRQLTPAFASLLTLSESQTDPAAWLATWQPMLKLIEADFDRGNGLLNTNGFLAQNIISAYETVHPAFDLMTAVQGLGLSPSLFVAAAPDMIGSTEADIFYLDGSGQTAEGGLGLDNYIAGAHFGHDVISDIEAPLGPQDEDVLRFTDLNPDDVTVTRDGIDLVLSAHGGADTIRITGQFLGEWNGPLGSGYWADEGVANIVFADGTTWDQFDMARAASHPDNASTTVTGTADNDFMDGGQGNDLLQGGGDGDVYVFGTGYGHDTISDVEDNPFREAFDILTFREGIGMDDLSFHRDGNSNDLTISVGSDDVTIDGEFTATYTGVFGLIFSNQVELLTFQDGSMMGTDEIEQKVIETYETSGNDSVYGFAREDTLDGGQGNDFLSGGNENDTYVFGRGYGHDTISDAMDNILGGQTDTLVFNADVLQSDVVFTRDGADLVVSIAGTDDSVRIVGQYTFTETGAFGVQNFNLIENFAFADGTVLGWRAIMDGIIHASETTGNDTVLGTHFDDVIEGKAGNDLLQGGDGADTYVFNLGDGQDTIDDNWDNILSNNGDTIQFGAGITAADIHVERGAGVNDAVLTIGTGGDSITIDGQFFTSTINYHPYEIETFAFADGTSLSADDLRVRYIQDHQTSGNDTITGFYSNDVFTAGHGDDLIQGGDGSDTYNFALGDGHDTIVDNEANILADNEDNIVFGAGITQGDIHVERSGDGLKDAILTIGSGGDSIEIDGQFAYTTINYRPYEIEHFTFADGSSLTPDSLRALYIAQHETSGNDVVQGFYTDDTIEGGAGNDTLRGGDGSDTYLFNTGFGQDRIEESVGYVTYADNDKAVFGAGLNSTDAHFAISGTDLTISFAGHTDTVTVAGEFSHVAGYDGWQDVETFTFGDGVSIARNDIAEAWLQAAATSGNDTITGFYLDDTIDGGAGNDLLQGGEGADTYRFGIGSGMDTVVDNASGYDSGNDRILFGTGIASDDVTFAKAGNDLLVTLNDSGDTLRISGQYANLTRIETFAFANGTTMSADDVELLAVANQATSGDDTITGTRHSDFINGGAGNDLLQGGDGSDTYYFEAGFGHDTIQESVGTAFIDDDRIEFAAGFNAADATLTRSGNDLIIGFTTATDTVTVAGQFANNPNGTNYTDVEHFVFGDGTAWTDADVRVHLIQQAETSGNDLIYGYAGADVFDGGAGNDTIYGYDGGDTYAFGRGSGTDTIYDSGTAYNSDPDTLQFKSGVNPIDATFAKHGNDLVVGISGTSDEAWIKDFFATSFQQIERFAFADGTVYDVATVTALANRAAATSGNDSIVGTPVADIMQGLAGNDTLTGLAGSDSYIWHIGDGNDTIYEGAAASDVDNITYGAGIAPGDITITRTSLSGAVFKVTGQTGSITVDSQFKPGGYGVEAVHFDNGTVWSLADIRAAYLTAAETGAADTVYGFDGVSDTLQGGAGNDALFGGTGSDTYMYNSGDGTDTVTETGNAGDSDSLILGTGLNVSGLTFARSGTTGLTLNFTAQSASITLANQFDTVAGSGVEHVHFGDGTDWSAADLIYAYAASRGTAGNDSIVGSASLNDYLAGGAGNDSLYGYAGSDWYYYNIGDGADKIYEGYGLGDTDTLVLGAGITAAGTTIGRAGETGVTLTFAGQTGSVYLDSQFATGSPGMGIEQIQFNDGTVWTQAAMRTAYLAAAQTSGNDTIYGFDSVDDTLQGGLGNDSLYGYSGSDTYVYNLGDGADKVYEGYGSGETDTLLLGAGITTANLLIGRAGETGATLTFAGQSGSVYLDNQFNTGSPGLGIEQIQFNDGTVWNAAAIRTAYLAQVQTSGNDTVYGFDGANDTLQGGLGNDSLYGYSGSDTYVYNLGDGADKVYEGYGAGETDTVMLGAGITAANLLIGRTAETGATLSFSGQSGSIYLDMEFTSGSASYGVEQLHFNDGTTWDQAAMRAAYLSQAETSGNNVVYAFDGVNDTLQGGLGNDTLYGYSGSDTYVYNVGDGADTVSDAYGSGETDKLLLGAGITTSDIQLSRSGTTGLTVTFTDHAGSIFLDYQYANDNAGYGIEQIQFNDGTVWNLAAIQANAWFRGTSGNDTIVASGSADKIDGGAGNDSLTGGAGADVFFLQSGFGHDTVKDFAHAQGDIIEFASGMFSNYTDMLSHATQVGSDVVITYDAGDYLTLQGLTLSSLHAEDFMFA